VFSVHIAPHWKNLRILRVITRLIFALNNGNLLGITRAIKANTYFNVTCYCERVTWLQGKLRNNANLNKC
jgi:hypothetical protein